MDKSEYMHYFHKSICLTINVRLIRSVLIRLSFFRFHDMLIKYEYVAAVLLIALFRHSFVCTHNWILTVNHDS